MEDIRETFTTEIKKLKRKSVRNEKCNNWDSNWLNAMNTRMEEVEEWINDIEDKIMENNWPEQKRESRIMEHKREKVEQKRVSRIMT